MWEEGEATVDSPKYSHSSVFARDWLTGPPRIPNSPDAQVPCVKWCRICIQPTHTSLCTLNHLQITHNT